MNAPVAWGLEAPEMAWIAPQHTRQQLNAAARALISWDGHVYMPNETTEQSVARWENYQTYLEALPIINNWRSSHSYPLNVFQTTLRRYARKVDENALIAQRIKRLSSIEAKLRRFPNMKMSQMQDIGGCRAVVKSISAVRRLGALYDQSNIKHIRASKDDYLIQPQPTGYRGIHLVYRYLSDKNKAEYNQLKIEIQLRSQFQHAWATAVETVGTFVQQALKSSMGQKEWLRFFELMGTVVAVRERSPLVPNTPDNRRALIDELGHYAHLLDVQNRLSAYGNAMRTLRGQTGTSVEEAYYYLLVLDPAAGTLTISGFQFGQLASATFAYLEAEKTVKEKPGTDAVLVSVDSLAALERAYPNYFADTRMFLALLQQALSGQPRRVPVGQLRLTLEDVLPPEPGESS